MIIKSKNTMAILKEGRYPATVGSIKAKPDEIKPKKIVFGYKIQGHEAEVEKEVPVSFEVDSPLRKDVETLLGRQLTKSEAENGIDLNTVVGKPGEVIVMHKAGAGGRPVLVVSVVLPSAATTPQPAAN
jgi:hypothetical protein